MAPIASRSEAQTMASGFLERDIRISAPRSPRSGVQPEGTGLEDLMERGVAFEFTGVQALAEAVVADIRIAGDKSQSAIAQIRQMPHHHAYSARAIKYDEIVFDIVFVGHGDDGRAVLPQVGNAFGIVCAQ